MIDLKTVINNLPIAVLVIDEDRRVMMANRTAERVSGAGEADMVHRKGGEVLGCVHAEDSPKGCGFGPSCQYCDIKNAVVKAFREAANIEAFEARLDLAAAGARSFRVSVTHIAALPGARPDEGASAAILSIEDVTEFKYRERLGAAMVTIGAVCHEMNQPLMACLGNLELMRMAHPDLDRLPLAIEQVNRLIGISGRLQSVRRYATRPHDSSGAEMLDLPAALTAANGA